MGRGDQQGERGGAARLTAGSTTCSVITSAAGNWNGDATWNTKSAPATAASKEPSRSRSASYSCSVPGSAAASSLRMKEKWNPIDESHDN